MSAKFSIDSKRSYDDQENEYDEEDVMQDVPNNSIQCDCSSGSLVSDQQFVGCPFLDCNAKGYKTSTCIDDLIQNFINDDEQLNCCNNDSPLPLYSEAALPRKGQLEFFDMEKHPKRITMENNGNTVELSFVWSDDAPPTVKGGPLNSIYIFDQLHYHWGSVNGQGSEHTIDDIRFEMEIHLIFYNSRYGNFVEAKTRTEGIVILAFLVEVSDYAKPIPFIKQLRKISNCGSRVTINEERFNLLRLIGEDKFSFFCYESNLIKPNCNDTVKWIVANFFNKILPAELEIFRLLLNIYDNKISDNFRHLKTNKSTNIYLYQRTDYCNTFRMRKLSDPSTGKQQSPVLINTNYLQQEVSHLKFVGIEKLPKCVKIMNIDDCVRFVFEWPKESLQPPSVCGLPFQNRDSYIFAQMHFHWSDRDDNGSEHSVDSVFYAMELHIVFFNNKYKKFEDAIKYSDGVTVIGYFIQSNERANSKQWLCKALKKIHDANTTVIVEADDDDIFTICDIIEKDSFSFYSYKGSLTTSPFAECVTWIIAEEPLQFHPNDIKEFRKLRNSENQLIRNCRPLQVLGCRKVYYFVAGEQDLYSKTNKSSDMYQTADYCNTFQMPKLCEPCAGKHQSPVLINTNYLQQEVSQLKFVGIEKLPKCVKIMNIDDCVRFVFEWPKKSLQPPSVCGLPFQNTDSYIFAQMHFHWSDRDDNGSEHSVDSVFYAMELHIVFFNNKYKNFEDAIKHPDGVTVIGYFIQSNPLANSKQWLCKALKKIHEADTTVIVEADDDDIFTICDIIEKDSFSFYSYKGSLTTSPFAECVTWIIAEEPLQFHPNDIKEFRKLRNSENQLIRNCRPLQVLGCRTVYYFVAGEQDLCSKTNKSSNTYQTTDYCSTFRMPKLCDPCAGKHQSPVLINTNNLQQEVSQLKFVGIEKLPKCVKIMNIDDCVRFVFEWPKESLQPPSVYGLPFQNTDSYIFAQMHFHWSDRDDNGSEHSVDSVFYAMELHIVFVNNKYKKFEDAIKHSDGVTVIGYFIQSNERANSKQWLCKALNKIHEADTTVIIEADDDDIFTICDIIEKDSFSFYSYKGSLTTSPFAECVTWIIAEEPLQFHPNDIKEFRKLRNSENELINNCRSIQVLGSRTIYYFVPGEQDLCSKTNTSNNMYQTTNYCNTFRMPKLGKSCPDKHQSPILISTKNLQQEVSQLKFVDIEKLPKCVNIMNIEDCVRFVFEWPEESLQPPSVRGLPLPKRNSYIFAQMHFHWSDRDDNGSEHSVDSVFYAMELHIVFFNNKYKKFEDAVKHSDGVTVIGYFIQSNARANSKRWLCKALRRIHEADTTAIIEADNDDIFTIFDIIEKDIFSFYSYKGSLTTSPFAECVTWIIAEEPLQFHPNDIKEFRKLRNSENELINNCRSIQVLGCRTVYYFVPKEQGLCSKTNKSANIYQTTDYCNTFRVSKLCAPCAGKQQSPVLINTNNLQQEVSQLKFVDIEKLPKCVNIMNIDDCVRFVFEWPEESLQPPSVCGLPLPKRDSYIFAQMHFHWSGRDDNGSEHSVDSVFYAMELHIVFFNNKYKKFEDAINHSDGVTVIGYFIQSNERANSKQWLCKALRKIQGSDTTAIIEADDDDIFTIFDIIEKDIFSFYSYKGSLTTSPFAECVTWIIAEEPLQFHPNDIKEFRKLRNSENQLIRNCRPLQVLGCRTVYYFVPEEQDLCSKTNKSTNMFQTTDNCNTFQMPKLCKPCSDKNQSPILIKTNNLQQEITQMKFVDIEKLPKCVNIMNIDDCVRFVFEWPKESLQPPSVCGLPFQNTDSYIFAQMHFHWSDRDDNGSEHSVDSVFYAMELHIVFFNNKYKKFEDAIKYSDGVTVIGYFIQSNERANSKQWLCKALNKIHEADTTVIIEADDDDIFTICDIIEKDSFSFYSYKGSLTTSPFAECVTWIIAEEPLQFHPNDIKEFRKLRNSENELINNCRSIQILGGRTVYYFVPGEQDLCSKTNKSSNTYQATDYRNTFRLPKLCKPCPDKHQSPILISTNNLQQEVSQLKFVDIEKLPKCVNIMNIEDCVRFVFEWPEESLQPPSVRGLPLPKRNSYIFAQMHFHWSDRDDNGSEHSVDSVFYAMELHIVFFNNKYKKFEDAVKHSDGVTVIGYFIQSNARANSKRWLCKALRRIHKADTTAIIEADDDHIFTILDIIEKDIFSFYSYNGSLTTSPFAECVTWIIAEEPLQFHPNDIKEFRKLRNSENELINNCRSIQVLGCRTVYYFGPKEQGLCSKTNKSANIYQTTDYCNTFRMPKLCAPCAGKQQSPVLINTNYLQQEVSQLKFVDIEKLPKCVNIMNIEDCVRFVFEWPKESLQPPSVCGLPFQNTDSYIFAQMHFHWSGRDDNGSEHSVNNIFYAMELHIVFFNNKYMKFEDAVKHSDGVTVIGYFIQSNALANSKQWLCKALRKIHEADTTTIIEADDDDIFTIFDIIEKDSFSFYSYNGSLTTSPFAECVTWIIAEEPLQFHPNDIKDFRKLRNSENQLIRNCRPLQVLGCRKVYYFVPEEQDLCSKTNKSTNMLQTTDNCNTFQMPKLCKPCPDKNQSPILISTNNLQQEVSQLKFVDIEKLPKCVNIMNIEDCVRFVFEWPKESLQPPSVCGLPFQNTDSYIFAQMHFHWSDKDDNGSEHSVDSVFYAMELHIVFFNNKYKKFEDAIKYSDGVTVIGYFIQSNARANSKRWLCKALRKIHVADSTAIIEADDDHIFTIFDIIEKDNFSFYSYKGSLTTSPFAECVTWIIAEEPLQFHPNDIKEFRKLRNNENQLISNCRPIQVLGCRKVYYFVAGEQDLCSKTNKSSKTYQTTDYCNTFRMPKLCDPCAGRHQSPVLINTNNLQQEVSQLKFFGIEQFPKCVKIMNIENCVRFVFEWSKESLQPPSVCGLPLPKRDSYIFAQMHFHWSDRDDNGSEHSVDSVFYAMELHIVFFNNKYKKFEDAVKHSDGVTVIGYFIQSNTRANSKRWLCKALRKIHVADSTAIIEADDDHIFTIFDIIEKDNFSFYSYKGSLTTSPFAECVTWIIAEEPLQFHPNDIKEFRKLRNNENQLISNCRPIQVLGCRKVYYFVAGEQDLCSKTNKSSKTYQTTDYCNTFRMPKLCDPCAGRHQSPVLINTNNLQQEVSQLKFFGIEQFPKCVKIMNIENCVRFVFEWSKESLQPPSVCGLPLPKRDSYIFAQMHFHWSDRDDNGSEHSVDSVFYAMELHIVFFNNKYKKFEDAVKHSDGVTVIGYFIQSNARANSKRWLYKALRKIHVADSTAIIEADDDHIFTIFDIIEKDIFSFYSYNGSLTTSPFAECVTWIIAEEPLQFHPNDIKEFRKLRNSENQLIRNCRPLQVLGCRKVYYFVPEEQDLCSKTNKSSKTYQTTDYCNTFRMPKLCDPYAGRHQSPVLINTNNLQQEVSQLKFFGIEQFPKCVKIMNIENCVRFVFEWPKESLQPPSVCGLPLPKSDSYIFAQMHFHWSDRDDNGSEHSVDSVFYAMELHTVFFNNKYKKFEDAVKHSDGVTVIGYFIQSNARANSKRWLCKALRKIHVADSTAIIEADDDHIFTIFDIIEKDIFSFYSYNGSLTTSPFAECVTWIIAEEPLQFHPNDIKEFRKLRNSENQLIRNCRPLQVLGCRKVYYFVPEEQDLCSKTNKSSKTYQTTDYCNTFRMPKLCDPCAGRHQSPVLINTNNLQQEVSQLKFFGIEQFPKCVKIMNIENCVRFVFEWPKESLQPPSVCGLPLPKRDSYIFAQMHFHWSDRDDNGSEHSVDSVFYAMELHIVFFNNKYKKFEDAVKHSDGVTVIGYFIQSNARANSKRWLCKALKKIHEADTTAIIEANDDDIFTIFDIIEKDSFSFYSYKGSLTTSPFAECVTWIIAEEPLQFHPNDIKEFRKLRNSANQLIRNCRPLQVLGCRKVYYFVPTSK